MRKYYIFIILQLMVLSGFAQDSLYLSTSGDTVRVHHDQTERNCAALFTYQVEMLENLITITEVDTGDMAWCMCYFDLAVSLTGLDPGSYQIDVWSNDLGSDPLFHGSLALDWEGPGVVGQAESECLATRDDTSFVELTVIGDTLKLFWNTPMLNCIFMPVWHGWLSADTFHVTMIDTGPPVDCICPFEVEASFAPFAPGTYLLDFWDGEYGYPQFSIAAMRDNPVLVDGCQSACYDPVALEEKLQEPSSISPMGIGLIQCYPNPFNAEVLISFEVLDLQELQIEVFSVDGRLISQLGSARSFTPGSYTLLWDALDAEGRLLSSGIYLLVFRSSHGFRVQRLVFLG